MTTTAAANTSATISTTSARLAMGAIIRYQILLVVLISLRGASFVATVFLPVPKFNCQDGMPADWVPGVTS
jgi:hypothetical protein